MKITKTLLILIATLSAVGCQNMNSYFGGNDPTAYANAKELAPLKHTPGMIQLSNRYDIPSIPNENGPIIAKIQSPNF